MRPGGAHFSSVNSHTRLCAGEGFQQEESRGSFLIRVSRREHHAFGKTKTHLARCEIRDHDDQLADQLRGLTVARLDAGEDRTGLSLTDIERELQELRGALPGFARHYLLDTEVKLREIINRAGRGNGFPARQRFHLRFFLHL